MNEPRTSRIERQRWYNGWAVLLLVLLGSQLIALAFLMFDQLVLGRHVFW